MIRVNRRRLACWSLVLAGALGALPASPPLRALDFGDASAAAAETKSFVWKVTRQQGTVYLAGSLHLLAKDYYPLSPALESAFTSSTLLVEEVDFGEMMEPASQLEMLKRGMLPADQSLDDVIGKETLALVEKRFAALGLPLEPLKRFKPWLLAITLLGQEWQKAGFNAELGLDRHFYDRARRDGKSVQGLETVAFQIAQFDSLTPAEQERMLESTIREADAQLAALTEIANAWRTGDTATIERIMVREMKEEPQVYQRLLVDRNRNWLPAIEALFARPTPSFVVVGAAHLVGADGLLAMLTARGYTVVQQ